jgi:hypothetical protein
MARIVLEILNTILAMWTRAVDSIVSGLGSVTTEIACPLFAITSARARQDFYLRFMTGYCCHYEMGGMVDYVNSQGFGQSLHNKPCAWVLTTIAAKC